LRERIDVEVISVEIDLVLSNAAKKSPWPSYVKILTANALDVLGKLGTFNLVFVDAAPIKYGHISSVLRILRPGGLLMIDDLEATVQTSEVEQTAQSSKQDAFRRSLLHHPELNVVEMDGQQG
jgi:predicted O-methyltransferase YrrM